MPPQIDIRVEDDLLARFDLIDPVLLEDRQLVVTANLPYVPSGFEVNVETKFEPQVALWGGEDGMDLYRKLLQQLLPLQPRAIFFECFDFQKALLAKEASGYVMQHFQWSDDGVGTVVLTKGVV